MVIFVGWDILRNRSILDELIVRRILPLIVDKQRHPDESKTENVSSLWFLGGSIPVSF